MTTDDFFSPSAAWRKRVRRTDPQVLKANMDRDRHPHPVEASWRQVSFLKHRCKRFEVSPQQLIRFGVALGRLHPSRAELTEAPTAPEDWGLVRRLLTRSEVGGLFAIIHAWEAEA